MQRRGARLGCSAERRGLPPAGFAGPGECAHCAFLLCGASFIRDIELRGGIMWQPTHTHTGVSVLFPSMLLVFLAHAGRSQPHKALGTFGT